MHEHAAPEEAPSKVVWENLEEFARLKVQEFRQRLLEEEVTELLSRTKSHGVPPKKRSPRPLPPTATAMGSCVA